MMLSISVLPSTELVATVVRDNEGLQEILPAWGDLFSRSNCSNVFLSAEWMEEWWRHYGKEEALFIIALRNRGKQLVGIVPLYQALHKTPGIRELRFLASRGVSSDHLDVLVEPGFEAAAIQEAVRVIVEHRHEWDSIALEDYDAKSPTMIDLRRTLRNSGVRERVMDRGLCPYIPLPQSFESYLAGLNSNWRRNFRHAVRMLQAAAPTRFSVLTDTGLIQERFRDIEMLHKRRLSSRGEQSSFLDDVQQAFHAAVLPRLAARGWVRLYLLEVGDEVVAAYYGYSVADRFLAFQSGIDPVWSRYSVGLVMVGLAIQESIRNGQTEFDFLRGDERYKFHWTDHARESVSSRFFKSGITGSLLFLASCVSTTWAASRRAIRVQLEALLPRSEKRRRL